MKDIHYRFPSGVVVEKDTPEELGLVVAHLTIVGRAHSGLYNSTSKGVITISSMNTRHLVNAAKKRVRDILGGIDDSDLSHAHYALSAIPEDPTMMELLKELEGRIE